MGDKCLEKLVSIELNTAKANINNLENQIYRIKMAQDPIVANNNMTQNLLDDLNKRTKSVIPITRDMVVSYTKDFVSKLLNIASECYTDIKYECRNSYISLRLRYYIGGNFIDININDNWLTYNNQEYNINDLFENTIQEKAILYDIKDKIQMFYKINA